MLVKEFLKKYDDSYTVVVKKPATTVEVTRRQALDFYENEFILEKHCKVVGKKIILKM